MRKHYKVKICPICKGDGEYEVDGKHVITECKSCEGTGKIYIFETRNIVVPKSLVEKGKDLYLKVDNDIYALNIK